MLGSQALDTAVGLILLLFVLATAASSILELVNRLGHKRAKNLDSALGLMLGGPGGSGADATRALGELKRTSVYAAATSGSGGRAPAYLSSSSFADAVLELSSDVGQSTDAVLPAQLRDRLAALLDECGNDVLELRAGIERWFDEAMGRLSDVYRRQALLTLALLGFALAVAANASTPEVAARLWRAPVVREAVAAAAAGVGQPGGASSLGDVAAVTDGLAPLGIPLGWVGSVGGGPGWWLGHLVGWALTALLVMVGAPFWFDLLGRLISFKGTASGGEPPRASRDPAAATPRLLARDANAGLVGAIEVPPPETPLIRNIRRAVAASTAPGQPSSGRR